MTATIKVSWSISTATSTIRTGRTDESVSQLFVLTSRTGITCLLCSLAWRYLGVYVDCLNGGSEEGEDSGDEEKECGRKLLWAAYHDPHHRGVSNIEEYSFFDKQTEAWNDSACKASGKRHRCARLDCHEPGTHMKLVGVFKETDGMFDWTEQLFKHEGVCIWNDEDLYDDMETWMGNWPEGCAQLSYPGRSKISIELLGTHSVGPFAPPQTTMVTHSTWRFSLCRKAT